MQTHRPIATLFALAAFLIGACSQETPAVQAPEDTAVKETANEPTTSEPTTTEPTSLADQLMARQQQGAKRFSPERMQAANTAITDLADSGIIEAAVNKGDKAPDFTLPNALGESVSLYDELKKGPVILTWYRGSWCPYCNIQLHDYQASLDNIQSAGAQLMAISPELPDSALSWQEKNELEFVVLSDVGNRVAREYGVVYTIADAISANYKPGGRNDLSKYNGDESLELPLAVTYVIGMDGTIEYAFVDADYRKRAETSEVVAFVQSMAQSMAR